MPDTIIGDADKDLLIGLAQELIRIPSQNPPGREKPCAEYIHGRLQEWGVESELVVDPSFRDRPMVLATVRGEEPGRTLILNGHMDVVPEGSLDGWQAPPFSAVIKEGRIYGRGASDMKGGLAVMIFLAKLFREKPPAKGKVVFQFVAGEEQGELGTLALIERMGREGDYGIVLEPTGLKVATAEKGLVWFKIVLAGKPAHGSMAERGINAIAKGVELGARILDHDRELRTHVHPLLGSRKCTITMMQGGTKENIVPESCTLFIDRRFQSR